MKKLLLNFIKTHEQKSKLDLISELLISGTVEENIELFNKVSAKFHYSMDLERNKKQVEINLINRIKPVKETDPNFDRPLNEIEIDYEIITAKKKIMKKLEDDLKVNTEYYLDNSELNKGIFLRVDNKNVYFKKTLGNGYSEKNGSIAFVKRDYNYKEVAP